MRSTTPCWRRAGSIAVDANPRQTALLELKLAGVRALDFDDFFRLFGEGFHPGRTRTCTSADCASSSRRSRASTGTATTSWFASQRGSFYFHGLSGLVACGFKAYLAVRPYLASCIRALFGAGSLDEQREIYAQNVAPLMWGPGMRWALSRQLTLSLLGVPRPQRREIEAEHAGGVAAYVRDSVEYVLCQLPLATNYFWRVYLNGRYTRSCCPEYLKADNFARLKAGLADCIEPHTTTVTEFLRGATEPISKFILLDHMDWMASHAPEALAEEWHEIFRHATPAARADLPQRSSPAALSRGSQDRRRESDGATCLPRADRPGALSRGPRPYLRRLPHLRCRRLSCSPTRESSGGWCAACHAPEAPPSGCRLSTRPRLAATTPSAGDCSMAAKS